MSTHAMMKESSFNPVFDSQSTFRALLDAISRPGTITELPRPTYVATPTGLNPHILTVVSTLCDNRVSLALISPTGVSLGDWQRYFAVNTSSVIVDPSVADYVVLAGTQCPADFAEIASGDPEFPETGATAIVQVDELAAAGVGSFQDHGDSVPTTSVTLSGPGVPGSRTLGIVGFDAHYLANREYLCTEYPIGVDIFLVDATGQVAAIPRSSSIGWVSKLGGGVLIEGGRPPTKGTRG